MTRTRFLALALAPLLCGPLIAARADEPRRFVFEKAEMGLPFRITLYAADETTAKAASDAAFAKIAALNAVFSDYDPDSELSRLARTSGTGSAIPVSRDLFRVLERAQQLAAATDGAFDVTAGPLINLWRNARRKSELPTPERIAQHRARVGWRALHLNPAAQTARLDLSEMRLDCGALAKGYAIDAALAVLTERGITSALVTGGGDMAASASPPGLPAWRIELPRHELPDAPAARIIHLAHRAIATSGDTFQFIEIEGVRYSHIVDPRTGYGLTDHSTVTVIAPACFIADSLSTALSLVGPNAGKKIIADTPGTAARIIRRADGKTETTTTPDWPAE